MKVYIISFNPLMLPVYELLNYLDTRTEVLNWYSPFAGTVLIVSNHNQTFLSNIISMQFPLQHFLITEATIYNTDGRLLNQAWEFIRTPKSSGRWDNDVNYKGFEGLLGYDDSPKK
mgnify:CR=1 FL=1|tara:strand:+ start:240 stop:587 length:348 start_codon:yes stop_codon:yes gene_type:complete